MFRKQIKNSYINVQNPTIHSKKYIFENIFLAYVNIIQMLFRKVISNICIQKAFLRILLEKMALVLFLRSKTRLLSHAELWF